MTEFQTLEALNLGISARDVGAAFEPFVDPNPDAAGWRRARFDRRLRTVGKALRRARLAIFGAGRRDLAAVSGEYEEVWSAGHERYDVARGVRKPVPWTFTGKPMMADMAGAARFRNAILGAVITQLKPKRVLEVGCGDGINLLLLSGAFPDISFTGLELTEAGNKAAKQVQESPSLPQHLARYAAIEQKDLTAFRRIEFIRGDASRMPFADQEFDLVYTILSIEQMEQIRGAALKDIARVTGTYLLNLEPFAEANAGFWQRLYVWSRNYFRGSIAAMPAYGVTPVWATMDFPQEVLLGAALVLSRKSAR